MQVSALLFGKAAVAQPSTQVEVRPRSPVVAWLPKVAASSSQALPWPGLAAAAGLSTWAGFRSTRSLRGGAQKSRAPLSKCRAQPCEADWVPVLRKEPELPGADATVLPTFPLNAVEWLGQKVQLNIIDPAYRKMYDDLLLSGSRHILVPFTMSLPGGRVVYSEMPERDRRLHSVGSVLRMEDLKEVSSATGGRVKYHISHSVCGRARIRRLLNPLALYDTDPDGMKKDYLRAEVEMLEEDEDVGVPVVAREAGSSTAAVKPSPSDMATWRAECVAVLRELNDILHEAGQPSWSNFDIIEEIFQESTSWFLIAIWHQLSLLRHRHSHRSQVLLEVQSWLRRARSEGTLGAVPAPGMDLQSLGMPQDLVEKYQAVQRGATPSPPLDAWEPFLRMLATEGAQQRGELLLEHARSELAMLQTRKALDELFD